MSRVSDTRLRTRQAAAKLVASGRRPHELTVDLIYAEIHQGSRTTINDELKLWKDEQAKVDALSAALPAPVANAMLATWALAIEHGENVFEARRAEMEGELAQAVVRADAAEAAEIAARTEITTLRDHLVRAQAAEAAARADAQRESDAKDATLNRLTDAQQQMTSERTDAANRLESQRDTYEEQFRDQRKALATSEAQLRDELARATERLEGVQKHVLLQVAEAREAQKRAEDQLGRAAQRSERLASELESLRTELVTRTTELQRATQDCVAANDNAARLQAQRDELTVRLATTDGRLEAAMHQAAELMSRLGTPTSDSKRVTSGKKRTRATA